MPTALKKPFFCSIISKPSRITHEYYAIITFLLRNSPNGNSPKLSQEYIMLYRQKDGLHDIVTSLSA